MKKFRAMKPHLTVDTITKSFLQSASQLLTVTRSDTFGYLKSTYGRLYAQPSKRLTVLLAADREIFILVTAHDDQQARTVAAAKHIIANEKAGRLESNICIIVHPDPAGNQKLKRWGREQGITILPVYFADTLPHGDEFERLLCRELFSHDPFDITGPVSDDSQFYGRRTEAQELARQLQRGQIRALLGIRRTGKTSIVNRVVGLLRTANECVCVSVDCSRDEIWHASATELMGALAYSVSVALQTNDNYVALKIPHAKPQNGPESLLAEIQKSPHCVVFVFDEIDYITPSSPEGVHWQKDFNVLWRNLRSVYQECARRKTRISILISGVSSKWFSVESIGNVENAALALIPEEFLSPLQRGASTAMIKTIARSCGLQFDDQALDSIGSYCSDVPFWIRKACSFIHRHIDFHTRPIKVDKTLVDSLLRDFTASEGSTLTCVALTHLFRVYPELETASESVVRGDAKAVSSRLASTLASYGIVIKNFNGITISGPLLEAGLKMFFETKQAIVLDPASSISRTNGIDINSSEEWADELAIIGRRRNLVEKKLRQVVLNFLRFDSVSNKSKQAAIDRILAVIDTKRRQTMSGLDSEKVMEKLFWTELVKLVEKEWSIFEAVFGDKLNFSKNCELVNERFDAHAKNVDHADLALYRRSLRWIEDRLGTL